MKIHDISPLIHPGIAVFPGDVPYNRNVTVDFEASGCVLVSSIHSTVHVGAHADAPNHYKPGAADIASRALEYYIGPCQVIRVDVAVGARIFPKDIEGVAINAPRVLFATDSFRDRENWRDDYNSLSPELVHQLADQGVMLVGIDTPSVDPDDSKALESHMAISERDLAILEGLDLTGIAAGEYELVAPPLKLKDADASPVRAVLIERESKFQET